MWDDQFEELLRGHLPYLAADEPLDEHTPLRELGLDSLAMVEVLSSVEKLYQVRLADDALTLENFETPGRLWRTLESVR
ncbi:acyl carrier protein [Kibdelosporangium persicum]|uniref:Phosphopantetheine attachment site n=1 Tax=Kibdelosporangium persicum TaxID=2698649 RepID=A0ABX2F5U1_9PSEU|nr:acyl carrier protein [Kibdelosporangium persicum]NRN66558.1 Phosphopantetheine attachment site [Kibdelosporangium persicum]